eukprot:155166_1
MQLQDEANIEVGKNGFVSFKSVAQMICNWGIETTFLSEKRKSLVYNCYKSLQHNKYIEAQTHAKLLLETDERSAEYSFLCFLCFDIYYPSDDDDAEYYYETTDFYIHQTIKKDPQNPIYLFQYAYSLDRHCICLDLR